MELKIKITGTGTRAQIRFALVKLAKELGDPANNMEKQLLITASIGLSKRGDRYYMQVITPHENEGKENGNYSFAIDAFEALRISEYDGIEIVNRKK